VRYQFIQKNRSSFPVMKMCRTFNISPSGFYHWQNRPCSARQDENNRIKQRISELYIEHKGMVGSPMITADLRSEPEFAAVSKNRVARHMRDMGLRCRTTKKFVVTTDSKHNEPVAPNILNREFSVSSPNTAWVSDITYVKVGPKWQYLTVFIDLFSRIVVGWDLSESLERHSMIRAFQKALWRRRPGEGLLVHSDRGVQYASGDFRELLKEKKFVQSMSRKGNCWDNAVAESFFHTLKTQLIYHRRFQNKDEMEKALFNYIEIYYNRRRRHSTNGYQTPALFESEWEKIKFAA
jgi:putative transposase